MKLQPWVLACSVALVLAVLAVPNPSRGRIRDKAVHSSPDNATAPDAEIKAAKDVEPKQVAVYKEGYQPPGFTGGRKRLSSSTKPFDVFALFQNDDIVIIFDDFVMEEGAVNVILMMKIDAVNIYFLFHKIANIFTSYAKIGNAEDFTLIANSKNQIKITLSMAGDVNGNLDSVPGKIEFNVTKLQDGTEGVKLTFDPATLKSAAMDLSFETPLANYDAAAGKGVRLEVLVIVGIMGSIAVIAVAVLVPCLLCEACCLHQRFCAKPDEEDQEKATTAATKHQSKEKKNKKPKKRKAEDNENQE